MFKVEILGNLGADATIKNHQGRDFVSFRVAHSEKWVDTNTGEVHERTMWASCALNGNGGNLTPYLKKGVKVFIRGNANINVYSSPMTHRMEAGLNVNVGEIELCGGLPKAETNDNNN